MGQHFLLSATARSLSPAKVSRMSAQGAENVFRRVRWPQTDGKPVCPRCDCKICYDCRRAPERPRWRCKACGADFSVTSNTLFAWHKLPIKSYLMAIAVFCNEVKGKSMLALCRDLDVQYKTAFVLAHKLREAMASAARTLRIGGEGRTAEIDGAYFGGHLGRRTSLPTGSTGDWSTISRANAKLSLRCASAAGVRWHRYFRPKRMLRRRSFGGSPRAPRFMLTKAPPGTRCTPTSSCSGSTIRRATASMAPALMALNPTSLACAAANLGIITTFLVATLFVTPRRLLGARICAGSAMASKSMAWSAWLCSATRRSISAAIGNELGLKRKSRHAA